MTNKLLSIPFILSLSACTSIDKSTGLGILSGIALGSLAGLAINKDDNRKGALVGGLVGAGIGAIAGYQTHKTLEKRDSETRKDTLFNFENFSVTGQRSSSSDGTKPLLSNPRYEEQFVETHVNDKNQLIEGHRIFTITDGVQWQLPDDNKPSKKGATK